MTRLLIAAIALATMATSAAAGEKMCRKFIDKDGTPVVVCKDKDVWVNLDAKQSGLKEIVRVQYGLIAGNNR
jgi:hypothetical protein